MDPSILELAEQGGPWAWAVLVAAALLWLPNLGLSTTAATGRRVPTGAFLMLVVFLVALAALGSWFGVLDARHDLARVGAGDRVRVTGQALEYAWIPMILAGRLAPALCTVGAIAVAIGAWLRAPDGRFSVPRHAIGPVLLGLLGAGVGALVDQRLALAAIGAVGALAIVSVPDDDDPHERRSLAARRTRVAVLGLAGVVLALGGAVVAAIARADGLLALTPWPGAEVVSFYTPEAVLGRHALLPAGLAPLGLVGLAGLAAVLPLSPSLGGVRTWLGGGLTALATAVLLAVFGNVAWMRTDTWEAVLPPRTQVAVPHVERVVTGVIEQNPPLSHRLTWTPRGVQIDGVPVHRAARMPSTRPPLHDAVAQAWQARQDLRHGPDGGAPWDIEAPAVARASDVAPMLRALVLEDPDVARAGIELVVVGADGYPGAVPVRLRMGSGPADVSVAVDGTRSWDDVIADVEVLRAAGRSPVLVIPAQLGGRGER